MDKNIENDEYFKSLSTQEKISIMKKDLQNADKCKEIAQKLKNYISK